MSAGYGTKQYDIAPQTSCSVDEETQWEEHPYVIANALQLEGERQVVDDEPEQLNPEEPEPEPEPGSEPESEPESAKDESIEGLRREYEELTGKPADKRWGAEKLEEEIEKALG